MFWRSNLDFTQSLKGKATSLPSVSIGLGTHGNLAISTRLLLEVLERETTNKERHTSPWSLLAALSRALQS